jgi:uncharacterized membrane protein YhaH (DUF805 family)
MTFGESIKTCFSKYSMFTGRATRPEYWWFFVFVNLGAFVLGFIEGVTRIPLIATIWNLAMILPLIAAGVRRMHDVGKSGWFLLIPFYNLYLLAIEGDHGPNEYGPDPLRPSTNFDFDGPNPTL